MNWITWNERQKAKEKKNKKLRKYSTIKHGLIMNTYKEQNESKRQKQQRKKK